MPTTNLAVVEAIYQAASLPYGGSYYGHDGFMQMGTAIINTWEDFQTLPDQFPDAGDWVIVRPVMRGKARRTTQLLDMPLTEVWRLQDGKVQEIIPFYWDTAATVHLLQLTPTATL